MEGTKVAAGSSCIFSSGAVKSVTVRLLGKGECAYDAEVAALTMAIQQATEAPELESLLVLTDCQSIIRKLDRWKITSSGENSLASAIKQLSDVHPKVAIRMSFCPGHKGVAPNELADSSITLLASSLKARAAIQGLPLMHASPQAVKDAVRRRLERDEDAWLRKLALEHASASAGSIDLLGASRSKILDWTNRLRKNRSALTTILRVVSGSAFSWQGAKLRCPNCLSTLSASHTLLACPPSPPPP